MGDFKNKNTQDLVFSGKVLYICLSHFLVGYDNNRDKSRLEIKKEREEVLFALEPRNMNSSPPPLAQCSKVLRNAIYTTNIL